MLEMHADNSIRIMSCILEDDFARIDGFEDMLLSGEGKAVSWNRASARAMTNAITRAKSGA